jgi:hypothetical protein
LRIHLLSPTPLRHGSADGAGERGPGRFGGFDRRRTADYRPVVVRWRAWRPLREAIRAVIQALQAAEPELTRLDSAVGDGDLGISLARGATSVEQAFDPLPWAIPRRHWRRYRRFCVARWEGHPARSIPFRPARGQGDGG